MKIGIIGAGHIGKALAKKIVKAGYQLVISNSRGVESLQPLISELGPLAAAGTNEEVSKADVIISAVKWNQNAEVLSKLKAHLKGKIVIDVSNRPNNDSSSDMKKPSGVIVSELLSDSKIVKAFNTLFAKWIDADPSVNNGKRVVFISGNDPASNDVIKQIAEHIGFAVVNLGSLEQAGSLTDMGQVFSGMNLVSYPA